MNPSFADKTVIVTGASAGVGEACARAFAKLGAKLVLVARGQAPLDILADDLRSHTSVLSVAMDVTDGAACEALFSRAQQELGGIHVLVNNAGFHQRGDVEGKQPEDLGRMIDVNLRAPIVLSRLVLPYLRSAGGGAIVNVASLAGCTPVPGAATYSASKFGLRAFTYALGEELRGTGIHVGVVSPGPIDTGFIMDEIDQVTDITFSQPMSTADEVADAVVALAGGSHREIKMPTSSGFLTTLAYLFPALSRRLKPMLEKKGRRAKDYYRKRARGTEAED